VLFCHCVCVCVCVCVCARARVCMCACARVCLTFEIQKLSESLDFCADLLWLVSSEDLNTASHVN